MSLPFFSWGWAVTTCSQGERSTSWRGCFPGPANPASQQLPEDTCEVSLFLPGSAPYTKGFLPLWETWLCLKPFSLL